jgi:Kef-type K+ transport system membrane component KefB
MKNEHKYMLEFFFSGITLHFKILIWLTIIILIHKYISHPSHEIAGDQRTQAVRYTILLCLQFVSTLFNSYQAYIESA